MAAGRPLPVTASTLVGRSDELLTLRDLLSGPSRLITLTGPPGVGKTRLAIQLAATLAAAHADGVAWVELGPIRSPANVLAEFARALGDPHGGAPTVDALVARFAHSEVLLVVDNCEHLSGVASAIAAVLDGIPRARVLATSRQRLNLVAEVEFPVPPLALPAEADTDDVAELARNPSVELLLARAPAHVSLTRRTARPLAEVCLRLDGLPLALELAAARLRVFTPSELAFRLEHRTVSLSGAPRDAPPRHRTLVTAIEWSHDLLPDAERIVFRRLSVLVGGWTVAAAQAVAGLPEQVVVAAIEVLLEQSLLQRVATDGAARFTMLASIRDFAAEQLASSGEQDATRDRHAAHFAAVAQAWEGTVGTEAENATWTDFEAEHPDLSVAFDYVGPSLAKVWLGVALAWYGHIHGSLVQAPAVLAAFRDIVALPPSTELPGGLDVEARTAMSTAAGVAALGLDELIEADAELRSAVRLSEARGDGRRQAVALSFLGHVASGLRRPQDAARNYRSARAICQRRGNVRGTAWSAFDLGVLMVDADDPVDQASAEPLLREALVYFEDLDYDWAVAQTMCALATALLDRGAADEAAALLARSVVLHDAVRDRRGSAQCLEALACVAADRGQFAAAARLLGAAHVHRQLGATTPTEPETSRLAALESAVEAALGRAAADHAKHTGRTAGRAAVLTLAASVAAPPPPETAPVVLTRRQTEVAALVAEGCTNRQIARSLGISEKTAEIHVSNIMSRLNVPSRAGVATWVSTRPESPA